MPKTTLTSKGQITLPREIRDHLGLETGDRISFEIRDGAVLVEAETVDLRTLRGIIKRRGRRVSVAEMSEAVRRGASKE